MSFWKIAGEFAKEFGKGYVQERGVKGTMEDLGDLASGVKKFFSEDNSSNDVSVFEGYNELYENGDYEQASQYVKDFYREYSLTQDYIYYFLISQADAQTAYINDDLSKLDQASNFLGKAKNILSPKDEDYHYLIELSETIKSYRGEIKKSLEGAANWEKVTTEINNLIGESKYDKALSLIDDHYDRYENNRDFWYYEWRAYVILNKLENDGFSLSDKEREIYITRFNNEVSKAQREDQNSQNQDTLNNLKERFDQWQQGMEEYLEWAEYNNKFYSAIENDDLKLAEELVKTFYDIHEKDYFYWRDLFRLNYFKGLDYFEDDLRNQVNIKENFLREAQYALSKLKETSDDTDKDTINESEGMYEKLRKIIISQRSTLLSQDGMFEAANTLIEDNFLNKDYDYYQNLSRNESYHILNEVTKNTKDLDNLKSLINRAENLLNLAISMAPDEEAKKSLREITGERLEKGRAYLQSSNNSFGNPNLQEQNENTDQEQEYIAELKACFEDGIITEKERRLLDKLRKTLGISEKRAKELESLCNPQILSKEEEEYAEEVKAVLEDGVVTEKERRLLNRLAKSLNISEERAKAIEIQLGIKE